MFRLNRLTDYAVVVMSRMIHRGELRSAQQIARDTGVPMPTVAKVLNVLTREGLVTSHRGAAGGYTLSRPADQITVAQIIQALEGPIALAACVDHAEGCCEVEPMCPMRGTWDRVNEAIRSALEGVTLADMAVAPFRLDGPPASQTSAQPVETAG